MQMTPEIESVIDRALTEDLCGGDPTTEALIPQDLCGKANLIAKAEGVLAGVDIAMAVFKRVDYKMGTVVFVKDSSLLQIGDLIASVEGSVSSILKGERTALNFLQRLSGIATETRKYVTAVSKYTVRVVDTRKTTPGLRAFEKYATRIGGGQNHRRNLGDGVLIKDNHIQALSNQGWSLSKVIRKARADVPHTLKLEVEVENFDQAKEAIEAGAEILLLDNMTPQEMVEVVKLARGRVLTEASGGITLETVKDVAAAGVDLISIGALTHSPKALDISLDLV